MKPICDCFKGSRDGIKSSLNPDLESRSKICYSNFTSTHHETSTDVEAATCTSPSQKQLHPKPARLQLFTEIHVLFNYFEHVCRVNILGLELLL
jgi:hypothetical protein